MEMSLQNIEQDLQLVFEPGEDRRILHAQAKLPQEPELVIFLAASAADRKALTVHVPVGRIHDLAQQNSIGVAAVRIRARIFMVANGGLDGGRKVPRSSNDGRDLRMSKANQLLFHFFQILVLMPVELFQSLGVIVQQNRDDQSARVMEQSREKRK